MSTFRTFALCAVAAIVFSCSPLSVFAQGAGPETPGTPASSDPYAFQRQGVFGCSLNGSYSMSVGALSAVGGAYVPVNDAAVTLNTGYLVYKECVLRAVVNREAENALAANQKSGVTAFMTGRDGKPLFPVNLTEETKLERDRVVLQMLQDETLNTLDPTIRERVKRAIARGYMAGRNTANAAFGCPYKVDLNAVYTNSGTYNIWDGLMAVGDEGCNPLFAYQSANRYVLSSANNEVASMVTQLGWSDGCYPVSGIDANGNRVTRTPGSIVCSNIQQLLQTGFKRLENANDIDQMVGALFSGITSHIIGDNQGLAGVIQRTGSQPSYLDKVVLESQQGLRNSAINAALQILAGAKQVEAGYRQVMLNIAKVLGDTAATLRSRENACWALIIEKVCVATPNTQNECTAKTATCTTDPTTQIETCTTAPTLKVATSTAYSQGVINAHITPLASSTILNIENAEKAIGLVDQLIAGVTNTGSVNAQRVALQQLDTLVSQKALHTQYDLQAAKETEQDVITRMGTLRDDTTTAWGDSTDPNIGWCNVNSQTVINMWIDRWRK